ncbi:MAG TPA: hypothetical protein VHL31_19535 [Geminicoccus sp.]|uniref:hypothetical protein n=1 Tax=Geminicoccus sp. TaxID=2024832 RepID=UPI002E3662BE|nr:hypothetical protein [Geminicoccus sp.]HEX2528479.1 hypothetical protein [Geminicoccus sp.]
MTGANPLDFPIVTTFGPSLCKTFWPGENGAISCKTYDSAKTVRYRVHRVTGLHDFWRLQISLQQQRRSAHVRAALRLGVDPRRTERLLHRHVERDGVVREPTMLDVRRSYVLFDLDGVPAPEDWHRQLVDFSRQLIMQHFPSSFRGVGFVVVASASAGIKPGARLRLGFLLDQPLYGHEIERVMAGVPIDPSTLRPVQPIYTAGPIFRDMFDPIPQRVGYAWLDREVVHLEVPPEPAKPKIGLNAYLVPRASELGDGLTLAHLAAAIATAPQGSRHRKLFGCAWRAGDLVAAGQASAHEVFHTLASAAVQAGINDPPIELARIIKLGLQQAAGGAA